MNRRFIDSLFFIICICLLFKYIPSTFWLTTLGGPVGTDWIVYPLLVGLIYTGYCQIKYGNMLVKWHIFSLWLSIYLIVVIFSLLLGLWRYPYYDLILQGPADQIQKLPAALHMLHLCGINIEEKTLLQMWMLIRPVKGAIFDTLYTFVGAYMIFCWYAGRGKVAFRIMSHAIVWSLCIVCIYGMVDVFYQSGNETAKWILANVNPFLHSINEGMDWSPRLFWDGQIRSVFLEPSYFGMYMAFSFPFLWYLLSIQKSKKAYFLYVILCLNLFFEVFLAHSRTAIAIIGGEILILIIIILWRREKRLMDVFINVMICLIIGFIGASYCTIYWGDLKENRSSPIMSVSESQNGNGIPDKDVIKDYVDENLFSLVDTRKAGKHAGSNKSRFTIIKTNLKIGMDHPFLGVGYGLRQAYITDYLPPDSELNEELRKWKNNQAKLGILRSGYPSLGEYYVRFAETGIMGLALFVLPSLILLSKFFKIVFGRTYSGVCRDPFIFSSIAFAGTAVVGLGDGLTLTWCYWLLLGLGFAFVTDRNMLSEHNLGKETP